MLQSYFEKYGHKCKFDLDDKFRTVLADKCICRRWFMKHAVISQKYILVRCPPRSHASLRREILYQMENYSYALHPFSCLTYYFDLVWMIVSLIWFISKPLDIFNHIKSDHLVINYPNEYLKIFMSLICLLDCVRRFFTGYTIKKCDSHEIVLDYNRVSSHYFKTYFFFDFISSLQSIVKAAYDDQTYDLILVICSFVRIVRLLSTMQVITNVMRFFNFNHNLADILIWFMMLFFIVHWVSCFSVLLGVIERKLNPSSFQWFDHRMKEDSTLTSKYVICLSRTLNLITGVGPVYSSYTIPENDMIYTIFTVVLGHILTLNIYANMYEAVQGMRSSSAKYEEMWAEISNYMKHHNLSDVTQHKVKTYYAYKYHNSYFNETDLLGAIPHTMRVEIIMFNAKVLVDNVKLFKKIPASIVAKYVTGSRKEIVLPGDIIFRSQTIGHSIYFLLSGSIAVFSFSGREIMHHKDGNVFGGALMSDTDVKRLATLEVIETSEIFEIYLKDLLELADYCPDAVEEITQLGILRIVLTAIVDERFESILRSRLMQISDEGDGRRHTGSFNNPIQLN